jgi:hypothetical protein
MSNGGIIGPVNDPTNVTTPSTTNQFLSTGTYTNPSPANITNVAVLVVAGGGGSGGNFPSGGGGGAGGVLLVPSFPVSSSPITVTIGGGGTGNSNGIDSSFGPTLVAKGGGYGGGTVQASGQPGGSGGGGRGECGTNPGGSATQGPSTPAPLQPFAFGNAGGTGVGNPGRRAAGGGGAGGAGTPGPSQSPGGPGGNGIDVTPVFGAAPQPFYIANTSGNGPTADGKFAGGGGGGKEDSGGGVSPPPGAGGTGGPGGGGRGGNSGSSPTLTNQAGTTNSGGGGGAKGEPAPSPSAPTNGGSGIVLVKNPSYSVKVASGVWPLSEQYNFKKQGNWTS